MPGYKIKFLSQKKKWKYWNIYFSLKFPVVDCYHFLKRGKNTTYVISSVDRFSVWLQEKVPLCVSVKALWETALPFLPYAPSVSFHLPLALHCSIKLSLTPSSGTLPLYCPSALTADLRCPRRRCGNIQRWKGRGANSTEEAGAHSRKSHTQLSASVRSVVSVTKSQLALSRLTLTAVLAGGLTETALHLTG